MSLIDQRIFIEASVDAIWSYVSDPTLIPKWNRTCKQISVLSTKPMGLHSRRRYTTESGRSIVEEITAWFEHLGYEAVQIDGPYHSFKSRFRLQAIPEGTIVNWSVEYRLKGPMGGLRDAASIKRQQVDLMTESLRQLKRLVDASGVRFDPEAHARFAMQSAPSPESRAARAPVQATGAAVPDQRAALKPIAIDDDDLPEMPVPAYSAELSDTTSAPPMPAASPTADKDDTKPRAPKGLKDALASRRKDGVERKDATSEHEAVDASASTVPISMVAPPPAPQPDTETLEVVTPTPPPANPSTRPDTLPERIPTGPMPAVQNGADSEKRDTKEASIWDVFGVERPSEKAQSDLSAVIASIQPKAEPEPVVEEQSTEAVPQLQLVVPMAVTPVRPLPKRHTAKVSVPVRRARG